MDRTIARRLIRTLRLFEQSIPRYGIFADVFVEGRRCRDFGFVEDAIEAWMFDEACASSHHWSRELTALGHTVRLMPPAYDRI